MMKAFYPNWKNFSKLLFVLVLTLLLFSCSETPEPDKPQLQNPPPKEDPKEDPDNDPKEVPTTYEQIEGKWLIGNESFANLKITNNASTSLASWPGSKRKAGKSLRIKDDYQGFIEFLADSTYILNDPKILGPKWDLYYGRVVIHPSSGKIELENYGEITNFNFDQGKFIFKLKEKDRDMAMSIEATKREIFEMDGRTQLLCKIWSVTDESKVGSLILEELKTGGVDVYSEDGVNVVEVYYPDGFTIMFTPSGTVFTAHIVDGRLRPFDMINWRWDQAGSNRLILTYDYSRFDEDNFRIDLKELTNSRLVWLEKYEDDEGEELEDEYILVPYKLTQN